MGCLKIEILEQSFNPLYLSYKNRRGDKHEKNAYRGLELTNHLGNVQATILDRLTLHQDTSRTYVADISSAQDYFPFGMLMPGRDVSSSNYKFGFNGMLQDNDVKGKGNSLDFDARIYDSRVGKFFSPDPDAHKYPSWSPYLFSANNPVRYIDIGGRGPGDVVVVFAGADLYSNGGLGNAPNLVKAINEADFNDNGGNARAFASKYGGSTWIKSVDAAYTFIKAHYNKDQSGNDLGKESNAKLVIYGYSWGGALAGELVRRLQKDRIDVDLLITVDAAGGPSSDKIKRNIPSNVKQNENYYQTTPSTWPVQSYGAPNIADDENKTNVHNVRFFGSEHGEMDEDSEKMAIREMLKTVKGSGGGINFNKPFKNGSRGGVKKNKGAPLRHTKTGQTLQNLTRGKNSNYNK